MPAWAERWHQDGTDSAHERTQCEPDKCGLEPSVAGLVCPQCRQLPGRPHTDFCTLAPGRVWNGVLPDPPAAAPVTSISRAEFEKTLGYRLTDDQWEWARTRNSQPRTELRGEPGPELDYEPDAGRIVAGGTRYDPPPAPQPGFCDARHPTTGHVCVRGDHDDHWHYTANHRGWGDPDDDPTL
jgi:hypothetical protein